MALSAIGAGGTGEVYRGRDTHLDRTVAIKVLSAHLFDSPELKQRFEREARAINAAATSQHLLGCTMREARAPLGVKADNGKIYLIY